MSKVSAYYKFARDKYKIIIAVLVIAFLANEVGLFLVYKGVENEANIINQAGRQRMYSQNITKLALLYANGDINVLDELEQATRTWGNVHRDFMREDSEISVYYFQSEIIKDYFDELNQYQIAMESSVYSLIADSNFGISGQTNVILENEKLFLAIMDSIVNQMEEESERKGFIFFISEVVFSVLSFLALLLTIIFVFVPIIKEMRRKEITLNTSVREKEALLSEIHHRVKNNLAIISGMLQLQIIKKEFSPFAFSDAVNRVQSIARIHELLYQTEQFSSVYMDEYVNELVELLSGTYPELGKSIQLDIRTERIPFKMEQAVPFALLLNELITNSLKHGFKEGEDGVIEVQLYLDKQGKVNFRYSDTGCGIHDPDKSKRGIGMDLINTLLEQLEGNKETIHAPSYSLNANFKHI